MLPVFDSLCLPSSSRAGRTSFYEEYGVIRDVLQNHLTEVLTLVAMELPYNISSSKAVLQHKLQAFQALRGLQKGSAVLGQYQAYSRQVRREQQKPDSFYSLTPTFAGGLWGHSLPRPDTLWFGLEETSGGIFTGVLITKEESPLPLWPSTVFQQ